METINSGMLVNAPPASAPAPNSGSNNSGKTIAIVVLVILLLLVIGYLFMSQGGSGTDETVAIGTNFEYGEGIDDISFTENPQRSVTKIETKTTPDTPDVETKTTSKTIDNVPITPLSNIRSKVTFITSKEEALSATSLLNVRERITFATPT
jgi:hypothetical protein